MNKVDRARQFLPFDALKGYKEAIIQKQRKVIDKKMLSEDDEKILSYKFNQIEVGMIIKVIYYLNNEYISYEGMVSKIDLDNKILQIVKNKINIEDIVSIQGKRIKEYEID